MKAHNKVHYLFIASLTLLGSILCACAPDRESNIFFEGNAVNVRIKAFPNSFNPLLIRKTADREITELVYLGLHTVDIEDNVVPVLAKTLGKPEQRVDYARYTFELKEGARWGDGVELTSADVAFTLKLIQIPLIGNEYNRLKLDAINSIEVDSDRTFSIDVAGTVSSLPRTLFTFYILPKHYFDPQGLLDEFELEQIKRDYEALQQDERIVAFAKHFNQRQLHEESYQLVGSGPYRVEAVAQDQYVKLLKKTDWWGDRYGQSEPTFVANPESITFKLIPEDIAAMLALRKGEIDILNNLSINHFKSLKEESGDVTLFEPHSYKFVHIGFNTRKPFLKDQNLRMALSHLIPYDLVIDLAISGSGMRTIGPVHPADSNFYNHSIPLIVNSTDTARQYLEAAGYLEVDGKWCWEGNSNDPLKIRFLVNPKEPTYENIALIMQQAFRDFGIELEFDAKLDFDLYLNKLEQRNFEMYLHAFKSGRDMYFNLDPLFSTASIAHSLNHPGYGSQEIDETLAMIQDAETDAEIKASLATIQQQVYDARAYIFLYFENNRIAVNNRIQNVKVSHVKPGYHLQSMKIKESQVAAVN